MMAAAELPFQPHSDRGSVRAFVLAAVVHCLLFAFLYFGISWTSQPAAPAQADLWASLPPMAVPRAVPPPVVRPEPPKPVIEEPPPPVKADIVQKIEKKKPEPIKPPPPPKKEEPKKELPKKELPKKAEPPKPVPKPQEKQPDPLASEMERMKQELSKDTAQNDMKRALSKEGQKAAPGSNGSSAEWAAKVGALVRSKVPINIANAVPGNSAAVFEVTVLPGREVGIVRLVKSSGSQAYDDAAMQAIQATSPLPPPTAGMPPITGTLKFTAYPKDQ